MKKTLALILSFLLLLLIYTALPSSGEAFGVVPDTADAAMEPIKTEQSEAAWFNEAWNYRQPLVISSGSELADYQVLIKLETNFDFDRSEMARIFGSLNRWRYRDGLGSNPGIVLGHWLIYGAGTCIATDTTIYLQ
jgi:hypothetical protein